MQITGMLYGREMLAQVGFPHAPVLDDNATVEEIEKLIEQAGAVFIKPVFYGGVGKKGKSGLIGRVDNITDALAEKRRLSVAEHRHNNQVAVSNGVTFEGSIPADYEVYVALSDSTEERAPVLTITHEGGVDIEELPADKIAVVPIDPMVGLTGGIVSQALVKIGAPPAIISPLVQHLPKLWELFHHGGMTTLEINPLRMQPVGNGRYLPVACDFKGGFDQDDPRSTRFNLPAHLFAGDLTAFEREINKLRTHQGQSDVHVMNDKGTILAPTFGGGANALVSEMLGDAAVISTDFGGNPPYEKMKEVAAICYRHWLGQSNVLFIIGGKANNTDIFVTFRAMADALREHFAKHGATPVYVVVGRGGPNLIQGMAYMRETLEGLGLPYRFFGFDSAMSEVVEYARKIDAWMTDGGREKVAKLIANGADKEGK